MRETHQSLDDFQSLHWVLGPVGLDELCVLLCGSEGLVTLEVHFFIWFGH